MASKRYVRSMGLWFALVLLLMALFSFTLVVQQWYLTSALVLLAIVLSILTIFKKMEAINHRLTNYFKKIHSGETAFHLPERKLGLGFEKLHEEMNRLSGKINMLEETRKQEESLFRAMIQNLNVGIFLLDSEQRLRTANPVAQAFLNVRSVADRNQLETRAPYFMRQLSELRAHGKVELEVSEQGEIQKWQVQRRVLKQENTSFELFLLTNLQAELEKKESEVTEKLMHTLTHEIMNSISPLTSLSETLQLQLSGHNLDKESVSISRENFEDIQSIAHIIQRRGLGLIEFVERYSLLARLPRLRMERIEAETLLQELQILMRDELKKAGIALDVRVENRKIVFRADKQLLLQVLINLVKNAREAYADKKGGSIIIRIEKGNGYNYISVSDRAGGVAPEIQRDIFLPFFSTKEKGSGIGLSLSRKIIQAHNGRLYLKSEGDGAEFRVELGD